MVKGINRYSVAALALAMSAPTWADETNLEIGGNLELDTDVRSYAEDDNTYRQGGRVLGQFSAEHTRGDSFVRAVGQLLLGTDGGTATDDAYIQFGSSSWDLQAGRFEAADMVPLGRDTIVEHTGGVPVYQGNDARGRVGGDGGQFALRFRPNSMAAFELGSVYGAGPEAEGIAANGTDTFTGVRPVAMFNLGAVNLTIGAEAVKFDTTETVEDQSGNEVTVTDTTDYTGFGASAGFNVGGAYFSIGAASRDGEIKGAESKVTSAIANLTIGDLVLGAVHSTTEPEDLDREPSVNTFYANYSVPLLGFDNAQTIFGVSHSTADDVGTTVDDELTVARVRFFYAF